MRIRRPCLPILLSFAVLVVGAEASAQAESALAAAKAHYQKGAALYDEGHYAEAIREFKFAYDLSGRADLLLDLARAEGRIGEESTAIAYLQQYVAAAPNAVDAASVRAEIDARQKALAEAEARRRAEAETVRARRDAEAAALAASRTAREREEREARERSEARARRRLRTPALVGLGAGVACVVAGVVLGIVAARDAQTVASGRGEFGGAAADADARGPIASRAGVALDVIGGAIAVAGAGVLLYASRGASVEPAPRSTAVRLLPSPGGVALAGSF